MRVKADLHKASHSVRNGDEANTFVTGGWACGSQLLLNLWRLAGHGGVSDHWALAFLRSIGLCTINVNWLVWKMA